ncbi:hypothetical protein V8G69_15530 [Gaetbulibacter sp. M235]|uniref:hypothetical protein n=1 Tax=Gaetbulibacter sp. M235 TaxID=3126510 RepID=UPI00374EADC0
MNTKLIMVSSSIFLGVVGIGLTFFLQEISKVLDFETDILIILFSQIVGSLYLGFATLNWMSRNTIIGGIYGKPLTIGNLIHFLVSFFALFKILPITSNHFQLLFATAVIYGILTLAFGYLMILHPKKIFKKI